jgi:hypothetical protein
MMVAALPCETVTSSHLAIDHHVPDDCKFVIFLYVHFKDNSLGSLSESRKTVFITVNWTTLFCMFFACFVSETTKKIWMKVCTEGTQALNPLWDIFSPALCNAQTVIIRVLTNSSFGNKLIYNIKYRSN